jgi:hypothetical protein
VLLETGLTIAKLPAHRYPKCARIPSSQPPLLECCDDRLNPPCISRSAARSVEACGLRAPAPIARCRQRVGVRPCRACMRIPLYPDEATVALEVMGPKRTKDWPEKARYLEDKHGTAPRR